MPRPFLTFTSFYPMFGALKDKITIVMIGEKSGFMKSSAGPAVAIDYERAGSKMENTFLLRAYLPVPTWHWR